MKTSRCLLLALIAAVAAGLAAAPPAHANPHLDGCVRAQGSSTALADKCRRAIEWGSLNAREMAAAWTNIGVAYSELGRDGDALGAFDRAALADPRFAPVFINRALARSRRGMTDKALEDWSTAASLRPRDPEPLVGRATLQLQRGRASEALTDLDQAVRLAPGDVDAQFNRGVALEALGRKDDAAQAFSQVLMIDPRDASAYLRRGVILAEKDPARGLQDLDAALSISPNWAAAWATRGRINEAAGRREAAAGDYRRAFELGYQAPWLNQKIEALGG